MTNEELLGEVEDVIRTVPPRETIRHQFEQNYAWSGRASAVIEAWSPAHGIAFSANLARLHSSIAALDVRGAFEAPIVMLHQARADLRMKTSGPISTAIGQGMVFDYFDELRKIVEGARQEVFWVDPYLDAEFVSRYLPHVAPGTAIRLLAREKLTTLLPAVDAFVKHAAHLSWSARRRSSTIGICSSIGANATNRAHRSRMAESRRQP